MHLITAVIDILGVVASFIVFAPIVSGNGVYVRHERWIHGFLAVLAIGIVNAGLWYLLSFATLGLVLAAQVVTFGIVGWFVNGWAVYLFGRAFPRVLYVRSYWSAFWAAMVLSIAASFFMGHGL